MKRFSNLDAMLARCATDLGLTGVSVRLLSDDPAELASAATLLWRSFVERESMTRTLVAADPHGVVEAEMHELSVGLVEEIAPLGFSFVAVDGAGKVIGLLLNAPSSGDELALPPSLAPVASVLNALTLALNERLADHDPRPELMEVVMAATDSDYLGHGLMRRLCKATATLARWHGFSGVVTEATSNSQIVFARHMGMETIGSVDYSTIPEFVSIPTRRDADRRPPITHALLMWAPIERPEQFDDLAAAEVAAEA